MSYASDTKRLRMYTDNRVKCKCGHSHFMPVFLSHKYADGVVKWYLETNKKSLNTN